MICSCKVAIVEIYTEQSCKKITNCSIEMRKL
ncbi:MAG: hypothetical protein ACI88H_002283 [Cocleimonas sp.]